MSESIKEAEISLSEGGVPIGAVIVKDNEIISRGHNRLIQNNSVIFHAEMDAIENAKDLTYEDYRRCTLYTTLSPCPMCSGAIIMSRIGEVIFGVSDSKMGCLGGSLAMQEIKSFNHTPIVKKGILEDDCAKLLEYFFEKKRKR